jgi:hypothetical protein
VQPMLLSMPAFLFHFVFAQSRFIADFLIFGLSFFHFLFPSTSRFLPILFLPLLPLLSPLPHPPPLSIRSLALSTQPHTPRRAT